MDDPATQRFIDLLTAEAEHLRQMAAAWEEVEGRYGGTHLTDLDGNTLVTVSEKVQQCRAREGELRQLIERVRHN